MLCFKVAAQSCDFVNQHLFVAKRLVSYVNKNRKGWQLTGKTCKYSTFLFPIDKLHNGRMEKLLHIPPFFFMYLSSIVDLLNVNIQKEAIRISRSGISKRGAFLFFPLCPYLKKECAKLLENLRGSTSESSLSSVSTSTMVKAERFNAGLAVELFGLGCVVGLAWGVEGSED
jgi:hypothetical protein